MPRVLQRDQFYPWLAAAVLAIIIVDISLVWHLFWKQQAGSRKERGLGCNSQELPEGEGFNLAVLGPVPGGKIGSPEPALLARALQERRRTGSTRAGSRRRRERQPRWSSCGVRA